MVRFHLGEKIPPLHKNNAVNLGGKELKVLQRSIKIIVVLALNSYPAFLKAQNPFRQPRTLQEIVGRKEFEIKQWSYGSSPDFMKRVVLNVGFPVKPVIMRKNISYAGVSEPAPVYHYFSLSPKYYCQTLGVICKNELQVEKITKVAFRFRLGSLEYVNWMEQKPNAVKPGLQRY